MTELIRVDNVKSPTIAVLTLWNYTIGEILRQLVKAVKSFRQTKVGVV